MAGDQRFMMFVAWILLLPGGIVVARYLKHVKGDLCFEAHIYLQYSGFGCHVHGGSLCGRRAPGFLFQILTC